MSEVIVRMEMPTGCANCPMADDDSRFCKAAKEYIPMLGRPSWCPIKGVLPDEHGRLGDLDRLAMIVDVEIINAIQEGSDTNLYYLLGDMIEQAKTIVPATERSET